MSSLVKSNKIIDYTIVLPTLQSEIKLLLSRVFNVGLNFGTGRLSLHLNIHHLGPEMLQNIIKYLSSQSKRP